MAKVAVIMKSSCRAGGEPFLSLADRAAVHLAVGRFDGAVTALTVDRDDEAGRYALAAGADSLERFTWNESGRYEVILMGQSVIESHGDLFAGRLASTCGASLLFDVLDATSGGDRLRVTLDVGRGAREVVSVTPPVVLVMAADVPKPPYVSQYRLSRVILPEREPGTVPIADNEEHHWEPARPRAKSTQKPAVALDGADRMAGPFGAMNAAANDLDQLIEDDAESCARHLLRYLRHHGFVAAGEDTGETMKPATISAAKAAARVEVISAGAIRRPMPLEPKVSRRWDRWPKRVRGSQEIPPATSRAPRKLDADGRSILRHSHRRRPKKLNESTSRES